MEAADLFLGKAASDLAAARLLAGDDDQEDDVVGFHAQLVVEKSLKAVVAVRSLEIPRSHDLGLLIRLPDSAGRRLPKGIREPDWLNPVGGHSAIRPAGATLDRSLAVEVATRSRLWARECVNAARKDEHAG
ncbi:MAG: HEPN domain-containing protein [Solirubrobacterales bacterium]|nr:HEPN domain-containing protein [Solirubrobacterales bacterium]